MAISLNDIGGQWQGKSRVYFWHCEFCDVCKSASRHIWWHIVIQTWYPEIWEDIYRRYLKLWNGWDSFSGGNAPGTPVYGICMCGQHSCLLCKDQKTKL